MQQQSYWNSVSESKNFTTPFQSDVFTSLIPRSARILDVGCGYGRTLEELYHLGYRDLTGIDFSSGMIKRGQGLYPHLDLRIKQSDRIDFEDKRFDAVILFAVLTCIVRDDEQQFLIHEISRVLKPGGILYVNDFLLNDDARNIARYQQYEKQYGCYGVFELPEGALLRHHAKAWIRSLLSGFTEEKSADVTFTTMNGHQARGFYFFGRNPAAAL